jgi:starch synthase
VTGILNGLDYEEWNPASDRALKMNFDKESLEGKTVCKNDVSSLAGFRDPALPLVGIIGRLTTQKGFDVVAECVDAILKLNVNLIILGKGDPEIEKKLSHALSPYPGRAHLESRFDETLARKIYAGSDMFLMPSRFEPCGLAQMIAMRYGSVPIVSATGGLKDTVADFNSGNFDGTGFVFRETNADIVVECTKRALCTFRNEGDWNRILHNAMSSRFSWVDSTRKYLDLYSSLKREHSGEYKK